MSIYVPDDPNTIIVTEYLYSTNQKNLERLGFQFLEQIQVPNGTGTRVTIPMGWSKKRISDLQVDLYDRKEQHRVTIADDMNHPDNHHNGAIFLRHRFYVTNSFAKPDFNTTGLYASVQMNTGDELVTVYKTEAVSPANIEPLGFKERTEWYKFFEGECEAWLDQHYPQWRDPAAYWDES